MGCAKASITGRRLVHHAEAEAIGGKQPWQRGRSPLGQKANEKRVERRRSEGVDEHLDSIFPSKVDTLPKLVSTLAIADRSSSKWRPRRISARWPRAPNRSRSYRCWPRWPTASSASTPRSDRCRVQFSALTTGHAPALYSTLICTPLTPSVSGVRASRLVFPLTEPLRGLEGKRCFRQTGCIPRLGVSVSARH